MLAITTAHVYGLLGILFLWLLPTILVVRIASRKGRPGWLYLIVSLIIGWPIPLIAALIVRPRPSDRRSRFE
jgi:hypothetical protein